MAEVLFLVGEERRKFDTPGRCVPRHVVQQFPQDDGARPVPLVPHLLQRIDQHIRDGLKDGGQPHWFEGMVVTVQPDDGQTWSAEAVARAVVKTHPSVHLWCVTDSVPEDGLPAVARHVGSDWFLSAAARRGLAETYLTWRSWQPLAAVTALAALAMVAQFLGDAPVKGAAISPRTIALAAVAVTIALGALLLKNWLTPRTYANAVKTFVEREPKSRGSERFGQLVDDVAKKLQEGPFPRLVVVENYQVLDPLTQEAVERYFSEFSASALGAETWIVFEPPGSARLAQNVSRQRRDDELHGRGYAGTTLWEQQFLTEAERRQLLKFLERDVEAAAGLAAVKPLCEGIGAGEEIYKIAAEHRRAQPRVKGYTDLDLLYVLSLTSSHIRLKVPLLIQRLLDQQPRRARIVPALFKVPQLRKEDLRMQMARLPSMFSTLVRLERSGPETRLAIGAEVSAALSAHQGELALPDTALAHAFWAMYWFDDAFNTGKADEAFWIREIAAHVSLAGVSEVDDDALQRDLARQLCDVALFTARACLRVGLFRHVGPALQRANDFLSGAAGPVASQRQAILRTAWEAYSVFGDDALLSIVLEHTAATIDHGPAGPDRREVPEEIALFLDSLPLPDEARDRLGPALLDGGVVQGGPELTDYARVRGGWLALSALRQRTAVAEHVLGTAASFDIGGAARSAAARLSKENAQPQLVDMLTLNAGLWCLAVHPVPRIAALVRADLAETSGGSSSAATGMAGVLAGLTLLEVIDLSDTAALVARYLNGRQFSRRVDTHFLREGLTLEVSVLALASAIVAGRTARDHMHADDFAPLLDRIRGVRDIVADTLDYALPPVETPEALDGELLGRVDDLLRMCALVWRKMDVPQLGAFVLLRRLAFRSVTGLRDARSPADALLELTSALTAQPGYIGVMASLELSAYHEQVGEVSAHYCGQAASTAIAAALGNRLTQPLALLAVFAQHSYDHDLGAVLSCLAHDDFSALQRAFDEPAALDTAVFLPLLNVERKLEAPELKQAWHGAIERLAAAIADPAVKEDVGGLVEIAALRDATPNREEVGAILRRWEAGRGRWMYPALLERLLDSGYETDRIMAEAEAVCDHDPQDDQYNAHVFLALAIAEQAGGGARPAPAKVIRYLERAAPRWTNALSVRTNLRMYAVLMQAGGPDADAYRIERAKWQQVLIEREHLRTLPQLAQRREFFLLFYEYFNLMRGWGLALDQSDAALRTRLALDGSARRAEVERWSQAGYRGLTPIVIGGESAVVSADFLCVGLYLFTGALEGDRTLDEHRRVVNAQARRHLPGLLESIRMMPEVPSFLKQVFDRHSRRLELMLPAA